MTRPVRPIALVLLPACMVYPGATLVFQGLYPFFTGEPFSLASWLGAWHVWAAKLRLPFVTVEIAKAVLGLLWIAGVLGLWACVSRAWPLALAAAILTLFYPGGALVMAVLALVCLVGFRENAGEVPA
jgi:hypothetical protein